jgi:hypothetical protein
LSLLGCASAAQSTYAQTQRRVADSTRANVSSKAIGASPRRSVNGRPARSSFVRACCALLLICLSAIAQAQQAPAFITTPAYPAANVPFNATFHYTWNPSALGFYAFGGSPTVSGNTITLHFDRGCGFICPGGNYDVYWPFRVRMPALPAGNYTVNIISLGQILGTFNIVIGANASEIPALGRFALLAMAALLLLVSRGRFARASAPP